MVVIRKKIKRIIKKREKDFKEDGKEDKKEERRKSAVFKQKNLKEQEAFPGVPLHYPEDDLHKLLKGKQKIDDVKPAFPGIPLYDTQSRPFKSTEEFKFEPENSYISQEESHFRDSTIIHLPTNNLNESTDQTILIEEKHKEKEDIKLKDKEEVKQREKEDIKNKR